MTDIEWRWSFSTPKNSSSIKFGVALASEVCLGESSGRRIVVFGVGYQNDSVHCALGQGPNNATHISTHKWVQAQMEAAPLGLGLSGRPDPASFVQRYGRPHPDPTNLPPSIQLRCDFAVSSSTAGMHLHLRGPSWTLSDVVVQSHDFLFATGDEGKNTDGHPVTPVKPEVSAPGGRARSECGPPPLPQKPNPTQVSVSVCLPYAWGYGDGGPTASRLIEYTSYYLLLGARRVVVFDDYDETATSVESTRAPQHTAPGGATAGAAEALRALSLALGRRFVRVRGLCTYQTMLHASPRQHCQVLANNLCRHAARADPGPSFVFTPDLDEFLMPVPMPALASATAVLADAREMPGRRSLRGALVALATRASQQGAERARELAAEEAGPAGASLGGPYAVARGKHGSDGVSNETLSRSSRARSRQGEWGRGPRMELKYGHGVCLKFADVRYVLPRCLQTATSAPLAVYDRRPLIVRSSWRATADSFERGPSTEWRVLRSWGPEVRAKFLTTASPTDKDHVAIHHCCLPKIGSSTDRACALVEHVALEQWHVRHVRSASDPLPCRSWSVAAGRDWTPLATSLAAGKPIDKPADRRAALARQEANVTLLKEEELVDATMPAPWAKEYEQHLAWLRRRLARRQAGVSEASSEPTSEP